MTIVKPRIVNFAETKVNLSGLLQFLEYQGAPNWTTDAQSDAELVTEVLARGCYNAFMDEEGKIKQNVNISRVRKGNKVYLENILKHAHGSVCEHASVTYILLDISRVLTHEAVRHRLCAYAQESLRYVRKEEIDSYFPIVYSSLDESTQDEIERIWYEEFQRAERIQARLVELTGISRPDIDNDFKKRLQSANRRLIPSGQTTHLSITTNHRNWRWLVENRTNEHAEEEIRYAFGLIYKDLVARYPNLYQDAMVERIDDLDQVRFKYYKI